jgi:hypothetical protein
MFKMHFTTHVITFLLPKRINESEDNYQITGYFFYNHNNNNINNN